MKPLDASEFTAFTKRLQSALKRKNISVALPEIKEAIAHLVAANDNELTDELQKECLELLTLRHQSNSLAVGNFPSGSSAITQQEKEALVNNKAQSLGIQLSEQDIINVANQIEGTGSTLDDILSEVESALVAFAQYKNTQNIQKINQMFGRVHQAVEASNNQATDAIASGLQGFSKTIEKQQQDFKSSVTSALKRLAIPKASA